MNPFELDRPRFLCRVVRWRIALFGREGQENQGVAQSKHVASCPDCRDYFTASQQWESSLRRGAARTTAATVIPEGLNQRIVHALRVAEPTPRPVRSRRNLAVGFGGLAAGVALALVFLRSTPESGLGRFAGNSPASPDDVQAIVAAAQALPRQLWSALEPTAKKLTDQDPLQNELNSVYSNAQSAVSFLELNFLPTTSSAAQESEPRQRG